MHLGLFAVFPPWSAILVESVAAAGSSGKHDVVFAHYPFVVQLAVVNLEGPVQVRTCFESSQTSFWHQKREESLGLSSHSIETGFNAELHKGLPV